MIGLDGTLRRYAMSTCADTPEEMADALRAVGFSSVRAHTSLTGVDDSGDSSLYALVADR